jgi:hypothetical protein
MRAAAAFSAALALLAGGAEALAPSMAVSPRVLSRPQPLASPVRITAAIKRGAFRATVPRPPPPSPRLPPPSVSAYGSARFDSMEEYAYTMLGDEEESTPFYDLHQDDLGLHR